MFTIEQAEEVAKTIFRYEAFLSNFNGDLALHASGVLVSGTALEMLPWSLNLKLGADPLPLKAADYEEQHPLLFAAAFQDHPEFARGFVERLRKNIEDRHYNNVPFTISARNIPGPKDLSMRLDQVSGSYFHPLHAAWYTPKALKRLATEQLVYQRGVAAWLGQVSQALERAGQDQAVLREVATKAVLAELEKKPSLNTDYDALAQTLPLCDMELIEEELARQKNVYAILCIALPDPKPATMKKGLKALAASSRHDLIGFLRRPPTVEELTGANVKGAGHLWYKMPWDKLEPAVREHGSKLRAALLKRTELAQAREILNLCLSDHPARCPDRSKESPLDTEVSDAAGKGRRDVLGEWPVFERGMQRYFTATRVREVLSARYSPIMARLVALRHLSQRDDLARYTDPLLTEEVRAALASYDTPLTASIAKRASGEPRYYYEIP